jgi:phospholipase C
VVGVASGVDPVRPEVAVRYARALEITLSNDGATSCTFTLKANAYRRGSASVRVPAGGRRTRRWPLRRGWYDVTITCDGDGAFVRRLAGHVENGRPSVTDPAMGLG